MKLLPDGILPVHMEDDLGWRAPCCDACFTTRLSDQVASASNGTRVCTRTPGSLCAGRSTSRSRPRAPGRWGATLLPASAWQVCYRAWTSKCEGVMCQLARDDLPHMQGRGVPRTHASARLTAGLQCVVRGSARLQQL